jgi:hypothetical protein
MDFIVFAWQEAVELAIVINGIDDWDVDKGGA